MPQVNRYLLDPLGPFPPRWRDKTGPIRVMAGPVRGYVMVSRPNAVPFVLRVANLTNAERHPVHGPFELIEATKRKRRTTTAELGRDTP